MCRLSLQVLSLLVLLQCLAGCGNETVRAVDRAALAGREGFIADGRTLRHEVLDRLGPANATYENGAILVYHVVVDESGHINLRQDDRTPCDAYVMVFDADEVLQRHSLVKHGCAPAAP